MTRQWLRSIALHVIVVAEHATNVAEESEAGNSYVESAMREE